MRISDWSSDVCSSDLFVFAVPPRLPVVLQERLQTGSPPHIRPTWIPMTLKQLLTDDMKAAMKSGDKATLGVIRLANAAIKQCEVDERTELDDAAVLTVLEKMVKQRKDSVSQFEAANREDLAAIERAEIVVIQGYLPEKLDEATILAAIDAAIDRKSVV